MRLALTFASRRSNGLGLDNAAAHLEDPGLRLLQIVRNAVRLGVATVPANVIPTLKSALDKAGTRYGLDVFPNSRHGFQFPERDVYETHAAEESWSKVVAMWDRNLK
jgi:dienelactone hydrolase family protein